jgi:putative toxin-antitoxin system antitoxin component (TIGR02293 family)
METNDTLSTEVDMELTRVEEILGGKKVLHKKIQVQMDMVDLIEQGLTKESAIHLAKALSITNKRLAELLPISKRTLERYHAKKHLDRATSQQLISLARLTARGFEVFGDPDKFVEWMNAPCTVLGERTPISLITTQIGIDMVLDELGRIEHGVYY